LDTASQQHQRKQHNHTQSPHKSYFFKKTRLFTLILSIRFRGKYSVKRWYAKATERLQCG
jgi:hypothetical protein